jgi:hypothetical protein
MMDSGVSAIPFTDRIAHAAVERREAVMRVYVGSWPDAESPGTRETSKGGDSTLRRYTLYRRQWWLRYRRGGGGGLGWKKGRCG